MSEGPLARLRGRIERLGEPLCVGIDPRPEDLPEELPRDIGGIETFARALVDVAAEHAAAIKLNAAFFEALGPEGWALLVRLRAVVPRELVVILDAKRGDIGTTAERYAASAFEMIDADAITLSPYLGEDSIEPFLAYPDRLVYVLARTSNPSAGRFQDLVVDGAPLHHRVARWVEERWADGRVGLVVGATASAELGELRELAPGPAFLVPGVGAQGGDLVAAARACHGEWAPGLVNVSRGIATAPGPDWRTAVARAADAYAAQLRGAGVD
jgi:orotidine 5'-phosphate decarboxylase subfamily 2